MKVIEKAVMPDGTKIQLEEAKNRSTGRYDYVYYFRS